MQFGWTCILLSLSILIRLRISAIDVTEYGLMWGDQEAWMTALRRSEVEKIPCGIINISCITSPLHLVLLHFRHRPRSPTPQWSFPLKQSRVKIFKKLASWVDRMQWEQRIWSMLPRAWRNKLELAIFMVLLPVAGEMEKLYSPHMMGNYFLGKLLRQQAPNLAGVPEERILLVLQTIVFARDRGLAKILLGQYYEGNKEGACQMPKWWEDGLSKKANDIFEADSSELRERICGYSASLLAYFEEMHKRDEELKKVSKFYKPALTLELVTQPLLHVYPEVLFHDHINYANVYRRALELKRADHLKLLLRLPPQAISSPSLISEYRSFIDGEKVQKMEASERLSLCTGLPGRYLQALSLEDIPIKAEECEKLAAFGISHSLILQQGFTLLLRSVLLQGKGKGTKNATSMNSLINEKWFRVHDPVEVEAAIFNLGKGLEIETLDHLGPDLALKVVLILHLGTLITPHILKSQWKDIVDKLSGAITGFTLNVTDEEAGNLLQTIVGHRLRTHGELAYFLKEKQSSESKMSLEELVRSGDVSSFLLLVYRLTGIVVDQARDWSLSDIKENIKQVRDPNSETELTGLAILFGTSDSILRPEAFGGDLVHLFSSLALRLCREGEANEVIKEMKIPSLPLVWHRLRPELSCAELSQILRGQVPTVDEIDASLSKPVEEDSAQPFTTFFMRIPLYGNILKIALQDDNFKAEYDKMAPLDLGLDSKVRLFGLLDKYFVSLAGNKAQLLPLEQTIVLEDVKDTAAETWHNVAFYGVPFSMHLAQPDLVKDKLLNTFGVMHLDRLRREWFDGHGKKWIELEEAFYDMNKNNPP